MQAAASPMRRPDAASALVSGASTPSTIATGVAFLFTSAGSLGSPDAPCQTVTSRPQMRSLSRPSAASRAR